MMSSKHKKRLIFKKCLARLSLTPKSRFVLIAEADAGQPTLSATWHGCQIFIYTCVHQLRPFSTLQMGRQRHPEQKAQPLVETPFVQPMAAPWPEGKAICSPKVMDTGELLELPLS